MVQLPASASDSQPDIAFTAADLRRKLGEYEAYLTEQHLTPSARFTYVDQAGRFLRWLVGEYRPRNAAAGSDLRQPRGVWGVDELRSDLSAYAEELRRARLKPLAVQTYLGRSETFVRWLEGGYSTRGPNAGLRKAPDQDDAWLDESAVQEHVMAWLRADGWTILRYARGREHGTDIDAERNGQRLAVEVKAIRAGFTPSARTRASSGSGTQRHKLARTSEMRSTPPWRCFTPTPSVQLRSHCRTLSPTVGSSIARARR